MDTLAEKLEYLRRVKIRLRVNLEAQGVQVPEGATFLEMAELVARIGGGE